NGKLIQVGQDGWAYDSDVLGMGYAKYRDEYIKPITDVFSDPKYASLRIVAMLEPDSFSNMIINTNEDRQGEQNNSINPNSASLSSGGYCDKILNFNNSTVVPEVVNEGNTNNPSLGLYADSLRLAISEIHQASQVNNNLYTYMDISGATLLGWDTDSDITDEYPGYDGNENGTPDAFESVMKRTAKYYKQLVDGADGTLDGKGLDWIRGFASNTSGYTPVEEPLISNSKDYLDLRDLESFYQYNSSVDEMTYVSRLNEYFTTSDPEGYFGIQVFADIGFIIDTSRNGWGALGESRPTIVNTNPGTDASKRIDTRNHRGHWCNVNDAGVGEVPKASPSAEKPHLDAFFWMKVPGVSDGISFDIADFPSDGPAYNALDSIEKDIVIQSNHPAYLGHKSSETMCFSGEQRDGETVNAIPYMAPESGSWFHYQFIMLIENAHPKLGESDYD
ncbi:MAG: glycoside hydrolase family 6 protein, partial [Pseudomonadales bacterium]|nr:glycoside hydrolase family 6 protein [Pseudomonadales bacterium]